MKAKDLKLGDLIYRPSLDKIEALKVVGVKLSALGDEVTITYKGKYGNEDKVVKLEAEAIILPKPYTAHIYFDVAAAQTRQLRLREAHIACYREALEKAAKQYAEELAKYKDAPLSEPTPA